MSQRHLLSKDADVQSNLFQGNRNLGRAMEKNSGRIVKSKRDMVPITMSSPDCRRSNHKLATLEQKQARFPSEPPLLIAHVNLRRVVECPSTCDYHARNGASSSQGHTKGIEKVDLPHQACLCRRSSPQSESQLISSVEVTENVSPVVRIRKRSTQKGVARRIRTISEPWRTDDVRNNLFQ